MHNQTAFSQPSRRYTLNPCTNSICIFHHFLGNLAWTWDWKTTLWETITHSSRLPPGTASLLVAAFAKAIELTFVTSFVAFLGQLPSQRAFRKNSKGITVAEMQMRSWVLQPGTLVIHSTAVRYAAVTLLGSVVLFATLPAMFYTTASDALGMSFF